MLPNHTTQQRRRPHLRLVRGASRVHVAILHDRPGGGYYACGGVRNLDALRHERLIEPPAEVVRSGLPPCARCLAVARELARMRREARS